MTRRYVLVLVAVAPLILIGLGLIAATVIWG